MSFQSGIGWLPTTSYTCLNFALNLKSLYEYCLAMSIFIIILNFLWVYLLVLKSLHT